MPLPHFVKSVEAAEKAKVEEDRGRLIAAIFPTWLENAKQIDKSFDDFLRDIGLKKDRQSEPPVDAKAETEKALKRAEQIRQLDRQQRKE